MKSNNIDKYFDGHLEKPLKSMTPVEKLNCTETFLNG